MVKVAFFDKVTGSWAFEAQIPFQKYQQAPIVFRWLDDRGGSWEMSGFQNKDIGFQETLIVYSIL